MRKIPTLLVRDPDDRSRVTLDVTPGCEWVLAGEGIPTRKYDGTCVRLGDDGRWWARREVKVGKPAPSGFVVVEVDEVTGKAVGWEPIEQSGYAKPHAEALDQVHGDLQPGTYELCGPKVNGNPERFPMHFLVSHETAHPLTSGGRPGTPEAWVTVVRVLGDLGWEGIVWHHPDGRMAKLKARDVR